MTTTHILGFPRVGEKRQLKFALEKYWRGEITQDALKDEGSTIRAINWQTQADAELTYVTSGDFAWYDHVLGTSLLLGNVPKRHQQDRITLDTLFRVGRGQSQNDCGCGQAASDMTKWFNTNYHYLVPEFNADTQFSVQWTQLFEETKQALDAGHNVKPVLLGPLSYLYLGKEVEEGFERLSLLPRLITAYQQIITKLEALGVEWVQVDEPILALELDNAWIGAFKLAYQMLRSKTKVLLTTYFDSVNHHLDQIVELDVDGLHIDVTHKPESLSEVVNKLPAQWVLSVGAVNGRNVWRADLAHWLETLQPLKNQLGKRLWVASSCSLLHSPVDLELETELSVETKSWFAFAKQKVHEVSLLGRALSGDDKAITECHAYSEPLKQRALSQFIHKSHIQKQVQSLVAGSSDRSLPFTKRIAAQATHLQLPKLPTTTIGSFPQTADIRLQRSAYRQGKLNESDYTQALKGHIEDAVRRQEALDLDVLVHGEAERNDMVEYFAELLSGFQTTQFGWVQSYGSRCVKPAIVVADIEREQPMTVEWTQFAQSLTSKQMKGMLTGPVTILCWTFPREDISRHEIAQQLSLALRDEVSDLQQAGINIIQIDEPAIREGLPLKKSEQQQYLDWAVNAFKLSASSALPQTQIHTHMCYSEFNEIIDSVAALDADVITIETSRSNMELLKAFEEFEYPNEIGPGVYDIHSPNVPTKDWIKNLIQSAAEKVPVERLWVNPDCGLKTRGWDETEKSLANMVAAAKELRKEYEGI
ncbi:5-methyltetrahydropteroyltriglutamate--homocysteine S-methyltransferase [Vibrio agarivorans]|uniref:5-methyltetrahydropteroyltriglutamate-- homocysteine S-methyltransferase n=1 Tax=Vibrio agarivorans TaxID=153622 RepID=UPI0025B3A407|nr:5-methyltetrahydropteroyltriglutamate--homocysteine S-methyltransferase [Vibrio agarivorans]MDN3663717.1 5-methyltetrahydropteroyltriglutamate--homocysteine S-methyltransferase [Vibrio agarivorans]